MHNPTSVTVDATTSRPCPSWCREKHEQNDFARLHRNVIDRWITGDERRIVVVRYDRPDGTSSPAAVQLHGGGKPVKFTPAEARKAAAIFNLAALRHDVPEAARMGRAFTVAADLIDQE